MLHVMSQKNIVAAGLADRCEIQLSYAIGVADQHLSWSKPLELEKLRMNY